MSLIMIKFGEDREIAKTLLTFSKENDDVLLIQDGVLWTLNGKMIEEMRQKKVNLYAVQEDLDARGYNDSPKDVTVVNYGQVIDLIVRNEKTIG